MARATKQEMRMKMRREILGVVLIAFAIFSFFAIFTDSAGVVGEKTKDVLFGLLGFIGYLTPFFILLAGLYVIIKANKNLYSRNLSLITLMIYCVNCAVHLFTASGIASEGYFDHIVMAFSLGYVSKTGGGLLSDVIVYPVKLLLGTVGAAILFFTVIMILLILLAKFSPQKALSSGADKLNKIREQREQKKALYIETLDEKPRGEYGKEIIFCGIHERERPDPALPHEPRINPAQKQQKQEIEPAKIEYGNVEGYTPPPITLLNAPSAARAKSSEADFRENAHILEETLASFGITAKVVQIDQGPAITRYELQPAPGVKVSRIVNLTDDIALNLATAGVRIEAPIPGKAAIGIEVPNKTIATVRLRELLECPEFTGKKDGCIFAVGKAIAGGNIIADLSKMPHLLIAGATGSGKSVCVNSLIISMLYKYSPSEVRFIMVDPKVVELNAYNGIPHLLVPVVTDPKKAAGALKWAINEMTSRYKLFAEKGAKDLARYNELAAAFEAQKLPTIVIIIDELADLMMVAPGEVEDAVCRLAQLGRAAGLHLVVATQRPSVDVVTGLIKANIPSRIAFAVSSHVDSRTILDMNGAEKLLGRGDMLYYPSGMPKPIRVQGTFVSETEVLAVCGFLKDGAKPEYNMEIVSESAGEGQGSADAGDYDELLPAAVKVVISSGQASISMIQRKFRVGYARAARIVDEMEEMGIVSGFDGSKPRNVLITMDDFHEYFPNASAELGE